MTLDSIFPVINEAFMAGNRARKEETAQDTVNSINSHYKLIDYILKLLKDYGVNVYHGGCLKNMGCYFSPAGAPELTGEEHMYCVDAGPDEDPNEIFYDWFEEYVGFEPCEYVYRLIFVEIDDNTVMVGGGLNDNCDCEGDTVWHWDDKDIIRKALAELAEYKKTDEAFRAGNRARKRETVQDTVSDITDVHDVSADELEQALSVPDLRYRFQDVLADVIDSHSLPVQLEVGGSGGAGVSLYSCILRRNGEQICKFYWHSGGTTMRLYMQPENKTISGCMLYLEMNGKGKLYRTSLERLRLVLLGLDGDDLEEAFKAGNRARKKESVSDGIDGLNTEDLIREALRKCEPVRKFTIDTLDRMFNALPSDPFLMATSFKDGDGRNAPRACGLWDLRQGKDNIRFPCYIRPRGKQLWITVNPNNFLLRDNDYIIAEADHHGKLEFGPGVKELADILDDNYVLDDSYKNM